MEQSLCEKTNQKNKPKKKKTRTHTHTNCFLRNFTFVFWKQIFGRGPFIDYLSSCQENLCKWTENTQMTFTIKTQINSATWLWSRARERSVWFVKTQMSQLCIWFIDCVVRCCSSVHSEPYSINLTAATPLRLKLSPAWKRNVEFDFSHSHGGLHS